MSTTAQFGVRVRPAANERRAIMGSDEVRGIRSGELTEFYRWLHSDPAEATTGFRPRSVRCAEWEPIMPGYLDGWGFVHRCPWGGIGGKLWVMESAYISPPYFCGAADATHRDAQGRPRVVGYAADMDADAVRCAEDYGIKRTYNVHMPYWAARIFLLVTSVCIERAGSGWRWVVGFDRIAG